MSNLYSVYDVIHYIKNSFDYDQNLKGIYIKGEISNFTNHRSGHWYFTLKDMKAKINCVMFASYARKVPFLLKEGMKVLIYGDITMYEASGSVQLYATNIQMDGIGELFLKLEASKQKLNALGYFDAKHKKPLCKYPMSIGVVCAKSAAATQDVLTTINRRWPICDVEIYHSLVQGVNASADLINNLKIADQNQHDVILLVRGGGAIEDLWCFNDEQLAITIFHMQTLIVTGVGHESDTTLVDYVSDLRAPTPTAAAELVTPNIEEIKNQLDDLKKNMIYLMNQKINNQQQLLKQYQKHRYMQDPMEYIKQLQMEIVMKEQVLLNIKDVLDHQKQIYLNCKNQLLKKAQLIYKQNEYQKLMKEQELIADLKQLMHKLNKQYDMKVSLLEAYSPLNSLKRGYSLIYKEHQLLKSIADLNINDQITITMNDGKVNAKVINKEN